MLTTDRKQLAAAIRPFRAIHHLREAKILDVTTRLPAQYAAEVKAKFGTEIKQIGLPARGRGLQRRERRRRPGRDRPLDLRGRARWSSPPRKTSSSRASWPWPSRSCWTKKTPRC